MNRKELDDLYADKDRDGLPDRIDNSYSDPKDEVLRYAEISPNLCDYLQACNFSFSKCKSDGENIIISYAASMRIAFDDLERSYEQTYSIGGQKKQ